MEKESENKNQSQGTKNFSVLSIAWGVGYNIVIPLVALAWLGRWLDKKLSISPWLLLAGVLLAIVASGFLVYKKIIKIIK